MKLLSKIFVISLLCAAVVSPIGLLYAEAGSVLDDGYVPLAPLPGTGAAGCTPDNPQCRVNLGSYLRGIFNIAIAGAGILAFLMIVIGGFQYMSTDAISGKHEGREQITQAVWGFLLAISAYLILKTINPQLVELNLLNERAGREPAPSVFTEGVVGLAQRRLQEVEQMADQVNAILASSEANADRILQDAINGIGVENASLPGVQQQATQILRDAAVMQGLVSQLPADQQAAARQLLTNAITQAEAVRDYAAQRGRIIQNQLTAIQNIEDASSATAAATQRDLILNSLSASYAATYRELETAEANLRANGGAEEAIQSVINRRNELSRLNVEARGNINDAYLERWRNDDGNDGQMTPVITPSI